MRTVSPVECLSQGLASNFIIYAKANVGSFPPKMVVQGFRVSKLSPLTTFLVRGQAFISVSVLVRMLYKVPSSTF